MTGPRDCPTCRRPVPADAPGGACPVCLFDAGAAAGAAVRPMSQEDVAARFPEYEILGLLGRGGMGVVWKARQRALDRVVALKLLPLDAATRPGFAERFQREARALARLAHPNVVAVHEFGERDGAFYLVMEHVDGVNVRQAMREGRIGPPEALRIVPQVCDALQYAHEHGVVHRDIKPENVLLDVAGRVKVADFGLAKIVGPDGEAAAHALTGTGQQMGTPHYMAPEQWERPATVDHRADIYSLGVVFYEMLTGELPIGRFDPPSHKVQVDVRLDEVVLRSLEKAPERRWQHASEVKSEVGTIAATPGGPDPRPATGPGVAQGTARIAVSGVLAGAAALALAILVAVLVSLAASNGRPNEISSVGAWVLAVGAILAGLVAWHRAERRGARADPREPTVSRLAVVGAFGAPLALLVWTLFYAGAPVDPWRAGRAHVCGGLTLVTCWVASIVAWAAIRRSGGVLRGLPFAIVGTLLPPPVAVAGVAAWSHWGGRTPTPVVAYTPVGPGVAPVDSVLDVPADSPLIGSTAQLEALWNRMLAAVASGDDETILALYGPVDRERLRAIEPAERLRLARSDDQAGQMGLPIYLAAHPEEREGLRLQVVGAVGRPQWSESRMTGAIRPVGRWALLRATCTARNARGGLHTHVEASVNEDAAGVRMIEWWFPAHHVNRIP